MSRRIVCLCGLWMLALSPSFGLQNSRKKAANPPPSQVGFLSAPQISAGGAAYSNFPGVVGDFNGDGKKDVATMVDTGATTPNFKISVALSKGDGTFTTVLTPTTATEMDLIFAGDLNGDQKDDLIMLHAAGTVEAWLSKGDGTFASKGAIAVISNPLLGGTLFDVNGDGKLDVVMADGASPNGNIWTLLGKGDGTFHTPTAVHFIGQLSSASSLVFADFNNDNHLDFAGPDFTTNQVKVYLNNGSNHYQSPIPLNTPDGLYDSCFNAAGDLSGHATAADIVSANCAQGNVTVYVNNGDGTFQNGNTGTYYTAGAWLIGLSVADVNGDGKNDLVVTDQQAGGLTVLLGNGDGTVQGSPTLSYAFGGGPNTGSISHSNPALLADFNGDGQFDAMVPDYLLNFIYLQGYGDGSFRSGLNYYSQPMASGLPTSVELASGDFNGDGRPDFVVGNANIGGFESGISVFLSDPDGSMQLGVNYSGAAGSQLSYVAVADFDGDGKLDIAATDFVNGVVQIFSGDGHGNFAAGATYPTDSVAASAWGIVSADFNGDGHPDLAVINQTNGGTSSDVAILLNNGSGGFGAPVNYAVSAVAQEIIAADLGKKQVDLMVPLFGTGNTSTTAGKAVALLLGKGDGSFTTAPDFQLMNGVNTFYQPVSATVGDVNGDGKPDLLVTTDDQVKGSFNQGVVVALGNGDGTFQTPALFPSAAQDGSDPMDIKLTDLNRDGHLDALVANYKSGTVGVLYGKGDGTFYDPIEYTSNLEPLGIAVADVNGDGAPDVVTSGDGRAFSGLNVLLNVGADTIGVPASSTNPSAAGAPVTFTVKVTGSQVRGADAPTGTVTFFVDGNSVESGPLSSTGDASVVISSLTAGSHNITAQYNGDVHYLKSNVSSPVHQVVTQSSDAVQLETSANPAYPGESVTFSATVVSTSGDTLVPTGNVTFSDGTKVLGSAPLNSNGVATFQTSSLAVGNHNITAQYGGNQNLMPSPPAALNQLVAMPDYSLSSNSTSRTVNPGSSASYLITLTRSNGYDGTVTINCPTTLPTGVSCNTPLTIDAGQTQATLTIWTTGPSDALITPSGATPAHGNQNLWASLTGVGMMGLVLAGDWKKRSRRGMAIVLLVLALALLLALVGCGGNSSSVAGGNGGGGTPANTYQIKVTAAGTAGSNGGNTTPHPLNLTLVVQ
ncbi:MAG: FG-GAP-like repeat-containing protein [Terriglobales bacterium]